MRILLCLGGNCSCQALSHQYASSELLVRWSNSFYDGRLFTSPLSFSLWKRLFFIWVVLGQHIVQTSYSITQPLRSQYTSDKVLVGLLNRLSPNLSDVKSEDIEFDNLWNCQSTFENSQKRQSSPLYTMIDQMCGGEKVFYNLQKKKPEANAKPKHLFRNLRVTSELLPPPAARHQQMSSAVFKWRDSRA